MPSGLIALFSCAGINNAKRVIGRISALLLHAPAKGICEPPGKVGVAHPVANDGRGFQLLLDWSGKGRNLSPVMYVMEATGSYYKELACFLHEHGQEVCVALASKVKHYAKSLNVKTKTDRRVLRPAGTPWQKRM
ncbi:MAG: IS110 family transposase [Tannerella sp.]|nr:IS110 family transposase [Tannerella sp.]